ncbi:hypothetical protein B0H16DRAFT_643171 [Mycena metata]|uniref:Uncharacterized protein n=1 Tax=Mycena metata TaxID=1033252 RepID=A0AAD7NFG0_9AGAR|nr:hypothetical protein B0H16DRAFT_643171 [Mycena metata]
MATNMVPAIASTALPATPADEWADGMNEFIGTHVTRTPVGTPGPAVPGAFPTHLESESDSSMPKITAANAQEQASALLASAQSYLPSLEQAKAYLPQGVAAYLPSSPAQSPPTASAPVDVGHATSVPYTESAPEPYRQDTNSSSTVNVGHGATVPYTESAPDRTHNPNPPRNRKRPSPQAPIRAPGSQASARASHPRPPRTRPRRTRATRRPRPASHRPRRASFPRTPASAAAMRPRPAQPSGPQALRRPR